MPPPARKLEASIPRRISPFGRGRRGVPPSAQPSRVAHRAQHPSRQRKGGAKSAVGMTRLDFQREYTTRDFRKTWWIGGKCMKPRFTAELRIGSLVEKSFTAYAPRSVPAERGC